MHARQIDPETALEQVAQGLLFPSESDAPLALFRWPGADEPSPAALLACEGRPPETPVEISTVESELGPLTTAAPGADARDQADAARWKALVETLQRELTDLRVYRVGCVDIDVYVLGRAPSGAWLGYKTHAVET
jgi:hypothetical protein